MALDPKMRNGGHVGFQADTRMPAAAALFALAPIKYRKAFSDPPAADRPDNPRCISGPARQEIIRARASSTSGNNARAYWDLKMTKSAPPFSLGPSTQSQADLYHHS